jgi:hypothetical protein
VSTDIVGLVIAAQTAVGDLKIAIGDNESPLTNAECSVGVQIEANATSAQVCGSVNQHVRDQLLWHVGGRRNWCAHASACMCFV